MIPLKLVIATNENDILYRFWKDGRYEKNYTAPAEANGGFQDDGAKAHPEGVKETLSPAMDILVSSNFERLLWILCSELAPSEKTKESVRAASTQINDWMRQLKTDGAFAVSDVLHQATKAEFDSYRVSDEDTVKTIAQIFKNAQGYVLDPHSAVGITASFRSIGSNNPRCSQDIHHISLATAHPAKFAKAVLLALENEKGFSFEKTVSPEEFAGLESKERKVRKVEGDASIDVVRNIIIEEVRNENR